MAASSLKCLAICALLMPLARANAAAQVALKRDRQTPILLDSQSVSIDLKTNSAVFSKVRISQGTMSITADQGQASQQRSADLYFENNVWNFKGNVKITMDQGQLASDDAQITFVNSLLSKAIVNGKPAAFEQTVTKTGKLAKGKADTIDYDANKHVVRFLKDAYLNYGDNELRGQALKYDVLSQKVIAEEAEQNSQRVRITITPPPPKRPLPRPIHERIAGAGTRQELQITAGAAGFVPGGRERRGGGVVGTQRRRQDHGFLHDRGPHPLRARRDLSGQ